MTGLTGGDAARQRTDPIGMFDDLIRAADPVLTDGVHAVRTAVRGIGHRSVAGRTFDHHSGMALHCVAEIVIAMSAGEFGVSRAMAGFALQAAVTS